MSQERILVITHPRSGTHFLINSLCMNFTEVEFPQIRSGFASLEGLFWPHDNEYVREWEKCVWEDNGKTKVYKTHLLPSDILRAINNKFYFNQKEKEIIRTIYEHSKKLYVYRDGRDVLVSWYYYQKNAGGGLAQGLQIRLRECDFSEFIRMPNKYYMPIRGFEERDENRVKYWSSHVNEWFAKENVVRVGYESLSESFEIIMKDLATSLDIENRLSRKIEKPRLFEAPRGLRKTKRILASLFPHLNSKSSKIVSPAYPRKGIVGDWKEHFSDIDLDFFMKFAGETMQKCHYKI